MTGVPVAWAIRMAPFLISLTVNDRLIVASANTPTTSPAFSMRSAVA